MNLHLERTGARHAAGWDRFLTGWFQGICIFLGLSENRDLTLEVVGVCVCGMLCGLGSALPTCVERHPWGLTERGGLRCTYIWQRGVGDPLCTERNLVSAAGKQQSWFFPFRQ